MIGIDFKVDAGVLFGRYALYPGAVACRLEGQTPFRPRSPNQSQPITPSAMLASA